MECEPFQSGNSAMRPIVEKLSKGDKSQPREVIFKEPSLSSEKMLLEPHMFQESNEILEDITWPWNAEIYLEDKLMCNGVLVNEKWILADKSCLGDDQQILRTSYVAAVFGSKAFLGIFGPHEQIKRISCLNFVEKSNTFLMELESPVEFDRNTLPVFLPDR